MSGPAPPDPPLSRAWVPWLILVLSFLIGSVGNTLYVLLRATPSTAFAVLSALIPLGAVWYWFWHYLIRHRVPVHFDLGFFLGFAPFLVIPIYAIRAEKWRGLVTLASLAAVYAGTYLVAILVFFLARAFWGSQGF